MVAAPPSAMVPHLSLVPFTPHHQVQPTPPAHTDPGVHAAVAHFVSCNGRYPYAHELEQIGGMLGVARSAMLYHSQMITPESKYGPMITASLPFNGVVPAGGTLTTSAINQFAEFESQELTIDDSAAALFVTAIKVGAWNVYGAAGEVSAGLYRPTSLSNRSCVGRITGGLACSVSFRNPTGAAINVTGKFDGGGRY